eukprot:gene362-biopygen376
MALDDDARVLVTNPSMSCTAPAAPQSGGLVYPTTRYLSSADSPDPAKVRRKVSAASGSATLGSKLLGFACETVTSGDALPANNTDDQVAPCSL